MSSARLWIEAASSRDAARARAMLCDDVEVSTPFLEKPVRGADAVMTIFGAFVAATHDFEYGRIWNDRSTAVLEFHATVGGRPLTGLDVIEVDETGRISRFEICARPLSAIAALGEAARPHLESIADLL